MRYRVRRQDDNGHVFTVPYEGVWYKCFEAAAAVKQELKAFIENTCKNR